MTMKTSPADTSARSKVLHSRGYSCRQIAAELGISKSKAHYLIASQAVTISRPSKAREPRFAKTAQVNAAAAKITIERFTPYPGMRHCNSAMTDIYRGEDLAWMGRP